MPFEDEETVTRKLQRLLKLIPVAALLPFLVYFWKEIRDLFSIPGFLLGLLFSDTPPGLPPTLLQSLAVLIYVALFGFGAFFLVWLYLFAAQAWLPVHNFEEIREAASHFILFIQNKHGPTVFIRDGKLNATLDELRRNKPGVLVIDYTSAVALERVVSRPDWKGPLTDLFKDVFLIPRRGNRYERTRVCGPGITFTRGSERIRGVGDLKDSKSLEEISGVVDLRPQARVNERWLSDKPAPSGPRISAYTRDGIELKTNVSSVFTIGQEPDVIQVTYLGERRPENLYVVTLEKASGDQIRIAGIGEEDELDERDRLEIHRRAFELRFPRGFQAYKPLPSPPPSPVPIFNQDRVFAAVFSRARTSQNVVIPWVYLPSHVALDIFREILSRVNYDDLYASTPNGAPPVSEYNRQLRVKMRGLGLLSYRLVFHCARENLVKDRQYNPQELYVSEVFPLTASKVLRDRGIKVLASGFSDLVPVADDIYKQRLDNWRATWDTDTAVARAGYDLEAMRIRTRARVQAQQELFLSLSQIFEGEEFSQEILALRIFQALEKIASDPQTHRILPADTINLLRTVHDWLLPAGQPNGLPPVPNKLIG
jgi:hypothetical protein